MNNKKTVSVKDIIGKMPEDLTEIEKIRYIYLKLGKFFRYNPNIVYMDRKKLIEMYNTKIDLENITENKEVCIIISRVLAYTINSYVPESKAKMMVRKFQLNSDDELQHTATKVETSDGLKLILDLTADLHRIQNNLCTKEFGYASYVDDVYDIISLREQRQIDNKLCYTFKGLYMDEYIERLKKEMLNTELVKKYVLKDEKNDITKDDILKYKIDFILRNLDLKNVGAIETKQFIVYILNSILTNEEKTRVKEFNMYKRHKGEFLVNIGLRVLAKDGKIFYLRAENENFNESCTEELSLLADDGWYIKSRTIQNETMNFPGNR